MKIDEQVLTMYQNLFRVETSSQESPKNTRRILQEDPFQMTRKQSRQQHHRWSLGWTTDVDASNDQYLVNLQKVSNAYYIIQSMDLHDGGEQCLSTNLWTIGRGLLGQACTFLLSFNLVHLIMLVSQRVKYGLLGG